MAVALSPAQQQEKTLMERLDSTQKRWNEGMSSPLNGKKFEGTGDLKIKTSDVGGAYRGSKGYGSDSYTTRSFFGLKNPWFGKKVMKTDSANLWSKSLVANADKKFAVDAASIREFPQAKKSAQGTNHIVEKKTFIVEGKAQGSLDQTKQQLTIDEVREILNKNR
jgi:hypothetical protein